MSMSTNTNGNGKRPQKAPTRQPTGKASPFGAGSLPHAIEAERVVLGSLLLAPQFIPAAIEVLGADGAKLFEPRHAIVFRAIVSIYNRGQLPEESVVRAELDRLGQLPGIGGLSYLAAILDSVLLPESIHAHLEEVADRYASRRVIEECAEIIARAMDPTNRGDEVARDAQSRMTKLVIDRRNEGFQPFAQVLRREVDAIGQHVKAGKPRRGVGIGIPTFDDYSNGLSPADMLVIGARPGFGKTAVSLIAIEAIARQEVASGRRRPVAFVSMDTDNQVVAARYFARSSGISLTRINRANLSPRELDLIAEKAAELSALPVHIDHCPGAHVETVKARLRRLHAESGGLSAIVIDYLQIVQTDDFRSFDRVTRVSRELRALHQELGCPLIALSQLKRTGGGDDAREPTMSDLRESGQIEQDATMIVLLHRDQARPKEPMKLVLGKMRNAAPGELEVGWDGNTQSVTTLDEIVRPFGSSNGAAKKSADKEAQDELPF